uniref:MAM domain-containing protein n=1 Tax=Caenorhabditis tropicalis TaxID=1561998 RepID=A0A1I7U7Z9_9PELO
MGRMMALLVSEVITCQLGGASIKYWYYKTGIDSQLEVCIRQPPGNKDLSQMRCYDGVSTFGKQWIFRAVELPPIAQPFEIVFKTVYSPPSSVIALDNIVFEATLCGYGRNRREIRRIGYHDWQSYRSSNLYNGELMLIVAQDVADKLSSTTTQEPIGLEAKISILSTTTPSTTTTSSTPTTTQELSTTTISTTSRSSETTTSSTDSTTTSEPSTTSASPPSPNQNTTISNEQQFANFVNFLKQTAPVIPYIPTLVRSLTALDPRSPEELLSAGLGQGPPAVAPVDVRRSPVVSSHFYNTNQPTLLTENNNQDNQRTLVDLAKKFGLWEESSHQSVTPPPISQTHRNTEVNNFGLPNKLTEASIYPQNLLQNKKKITMNPIKKIPPSVPNVENIEEYHKSLFKVSTTTSSPFVQSSTELIIFKQPSSGEAEVAEKLADIAKLLPSGAVQDLTALRNIPDLDGLTKGMDLSDIRKPGGFGRLKTQFMERLMRRTLESSSGGASEGAGGTFDDIGSLGRTPTQLSDFDGNDVTINQFESVSVPVPTRAVHYGAPTSQKISNPSKDEKRKSNDLGGPRSGPMFASICANVDCTFDDNTLCNYLTSSTNVTAEDGSTLKKWALSNRSVLNSLTGIPSDITKGGYFLYAGGTTVTPGDTFILTTNNPVTITEPARVDFFVYQAGIRGQFRVCIDDNEDCPVFLEGKDIDANSQKWKNYYFDISPGQHVLHFVVEGLHNNYVIGIDNIQLLNRFGTSSLSC